MKAGYYLSCEGWKACDIIKSETIYGDDYKTIINKKGETLTLKAWKVSNGF